MEHNKPLKISLEYYNKIITSQVDHSDLTLEDLHELWLGIVRNMGYHHKTIDEFYSE
jgi:hypothetical protein